MLIEVGKLTPILEHTSPLHKAPDATSKPDRREETVITVIDPDDATPEET